MSITELTRRAGNWFVESSLGRALKAVVFGAGGFIGSHLVTRLKREGYWVRGVDLKVPDFGESEADEFLVRDLRERSSVVESLTLSEGGFFDELYQLAADMGGAGYIFTGANDANVMHNSSLINLLALETLAEQYQRGAATKVFYSSSACIYPESIQENPDAVDLKEEFAYPANPDSEYGWEKLFSERLFGAFSRNYGIQVRVARFHNVYGPAGTWKGGKEKAPAAICRKILEAPEGGEVEVWGDGRQSRSFLFITDCVEAVRRFMLQDTHIGPLNIGSEEMITINQLVESAARIAGKSVEIRNIPGPVGVRGRNSNNDLARQVLGWNYAVTLDEGLKKTLAWISGQMEKEAGGAND